MISINSLQGPFMVSDEMAHTYLPIVANILKGNIKADDPLTESNKKKSKHFAISADMYGCVVDHKKVNEAPMGSIMIMPITGPIMKEDVCGVAGTDTMRGRIKLMNSCDNIIGMIIKMNTGGGEVTGTAELAQAIFESKKPIVCFIDGNACSAGLWIASACKSIIASSNNSLVGSIGVITTLVDYSKFFEMNGIKVHNITAKGSEDKNKSYFEAMKGNYDAYKAEILNPLRENFVAALKLYRPVLSDKNSNSEPFTGKVYLAEKALSFGLIDKVGTFETAIQILSDFTN